MRFVVVYDACVLYPAPLRDFLKELLTLAKEVVQAEKKVNPQEEQDKAKTAQTELFTEVKSVKTPRCSRKDRQ